MLEELSMSMVKADFYYVNKNKTKTCSSWKCIHKIKLPLTFPRKTLLLKKYIFYKIFEITFNIYWSSYTFPEASTAK